MSFFSHPLTHFLPSTLCYRHRRRVFLPTIKRKKYISHCTIFALNNKFVIDFLTPSSRDSLSHSRCRRRRRPHCFSNIKDIIIMKCTQKAWTHSERRVETFARRRRGKEIHPTYFQWARLVSSSMRNARKWGKCAKSKGWQQCIWI